MRRIASLAVIVFFSAVLLAAQETPIVELFGGFAAARIDDNQGLTRRHITNKGWNIAVDANFNKYVGLVADFGDYYGTHRLPPFTALTCPTCPMTTPSPFQASTSFFTFMGGPQFSFRWQKVAPFVHALIGVARENGHLVPATPPVTGINVGLSGALGGGLDTALSHRIAFRLQADYMHNGFLLLHSPEHNIRFATGLVFRFGDYSQNPPSRRPRRSAQKPR